MKIIYRDKTWELNGRTTVRDAIKKVGLRPEAVLAIRDGNLITDDVIITGDDVVKLISVVSGG
jgi:sulfur carrier protein ThiS